LYSLKSVRALQTNTGEQSLSEEKLLLSLTKLDLILTKFLYLVGTISNFQDFQLLKYQVIFADIKYNHESYTF